MRTRIALCTAFVAVAALVFAPGAGAQGQGRGHGPEKEMEHGHGDEHVPPGHARKHVVTMDHATMVTREVLLSHGYEVVRVDVVNGERVVYYRRGNRGRGRGRGPVERLVIRPGPEHVVFDKAPSTVLVDINVRLGF